MANSVSRVFAASLLPCIAAAAYLPFVAGCALVRPQPLLHGHPESSGMVVLSCRLRLDAPDQWSDRSLTVGRERIAGDLPPDDAVLVDADDHSRRFSGARLGEAWVFPALPPGTYFLQRVSLEPAFVEQLPEVALYRDRATFYFLPESAPDLLVEVREGSVGILGPITVLAEYAIDANPGVMETADPFRMFVRAQGDRTTYRFDRDRTRLVRDLARVARSRGLGPWRERIERMIASLGFDSSPPTSTRSASRRPLRGAAARVDD